MIYSWLFISLNGSPGQTAVFELCRSVTLVNLRPEEYLWEQGTRCSELFVLLKVTLSSCVADRQPTLSPLLLLLLLLLLPTLPTCIILV